MSGIDKSLIVDMKDEDLNEFTCGICHEVFVNPVVTQCCRQTYCNDCIHQWLNERTICPNDRKVLTRNNLIPAPRAMVNVLKNMKVKCKYHGNGCESVVKVGEMDRHLRNCTRNQCIICGLGRGSEEVHTIDDCIENLKIKVQSITSENKRLFIENQRLREEMTQMKDRSSDSRNDFLNLSTRMAMNSISGIDSFNSPIPSTSRVSEGRGSLISRFGQLRAQPRITNERCLLSEKMDHFMNGSFKLDSKFKIQRLDRIESRIFHTILEIIINGNNFVLIRVQEGEDKVVKRFSLGKDFRWIRSDGKSVRSLLEYRPNLLISSNCRLIETMYDHGRTTHYNYDFDIQTKSLTIEWSVGDIRKEEIFIRID